MNRSITKRSMVALGVLVTLTTVTACGASGGSEPQPASGGWDSVVAAAEKEGEVTFYSAQGSDGLDDLEAAFEKEYPKIDLRLVRATDAELTPKVEAEAATDRGAGDVYVGASLPWFDANTDKFVEPVGPSFESAEYKPEYLDEGGFFLVNAAILTFGWNTNLHPAGLEDYDDLLDPSLSGGKIGVVAEDTASRVLLYDYLEDNYGEEFIKQLAAQSPSVYPSALPMAQAIASGEIAAGMYVEPLIAEKESGAPVDYGIVSPAFGARFYGAVLDSAPHPNAAQVLADFLITEDGQQGISAKGASVLASTPGALATMDEVVEIDPSKVTPEMVEDRNAEWRALFDK